MTATANNSPTEPLARLVRQKKRLLEQLLLLGKRQGDLIAEGEVAPLMQVLGGKQQLIAGLQVVEQGLDAFRHEDPDARAWPTPADREACRADAEACNRLLAELLASEQQHEKQLTDRRDAIGVQLRQAQSAHSASTAYKPHLRGAPRAPIAEHDASAPLSASLDLTAGG